MKEFRKGGVFPHLKTALLKILRYIHVVIIVFIQGAKAFKIIDRDTRLCG